MTMEYCMPAPYATLALLKKVPKKMVISIGRSNTAFKGATLL